MNRRRAAVLSTLLRLRRQETNAARSAVAAAQGRAAAARSRMDLLDESMGYCNAMARRAGEMTTYRRRVAAIRRELSTCGAALAAAEETLAGRRAILAEAIRRGRALGRAWHHAAVAESLARAIRAQKELEEVHAAHMAGGLDGLTIAAEIVETV